MAKRKIQPDQIPVIRELAQIGIQQKEIAQMYGVQPSRISLIVSTRFYDGQTKTQSTR